MLGTRHHDPARRDRAAGEADFLDFRVMDERFACGNAARQNAEHAIRNARLARQQRI